MPRLLSVGLVLCGVAAVALIVNGNLQRDASAFQFKWKVSQEAPLQVQLDAATRSPIFHTVAAPGEVEAENKVELSSQVPGRIERMPARGDSLATFAGQLREGDVVKKGQILVLLDSRIYRDKLRAYESLAKKIETSIAGMRADCEKAQRDLERNRKLFRARSVGTADVSDMETVAEKCRAQLTSSAEDLEAARATASQARKDLEECTISSPMDGVVSKLIAEEGENVVLGTMNNAGTVIMTISDMQSIVVRARIDETYVPLVKPGQTARIYLQCDGETVIPGKVKRVSPKGEKGQKKTSSTQTPAAADPNELAKFETLITLDVPHPKIRLGMTANVEIVVEERPNVLGIPPQAVLQRRARDLPAALTQQYVRQAVKRKGFEDPAKRWFQVVFVEEEGLARCKVVRTGISDEARVEIVQDPEAPASLSEGDRVVVGPFRVFDKLADGKAIKPAVENETAKREAAK